MGIWKFSHKGIFSISNYFWPCQVWKILDFCKMVFGIFKLHYLKAFGKIKWEIQRNYQAGAISTDLTGA
jgi:hypothetical protein